MKFLCAKRRVETFWLLVTLTPTTPRKPISLMLNAL
jgi:hypothetical protein